MKIVMKYPRQYYENSQWNILGIIMKIVIKYPVHYYENHNEIPRQYYENPNEISQALLWKM